MSPPNEAQGGGPPAGPAGGDPQAWVEEHGDALFRYALLRVRDRACAEDLVQETFLAAVVARRGFEGRSSERTWLIGILRHKVVDHLRAQARERTIGNPDADDDAAAGQFDARGMWKRPPADWTPEPGELLESAEFWAVLERCLAELPPRQAEAFTLRMIDEFDASEVCKALRLSATNLWVMLHRARLRLRRCLELNWFGGDAGGSDTR